ncbi:hypothetical protein RI367_001534 [Sorochytrium milnesiophthora]
MAQLARKAHDSGYSSSTAGASSLVARSTLLAVQHNDEFEHGACLSQQQHSVWTTAFAADFTSAQSVSGTAKSPAAAGAAPPSPSSSESAVDVEETSPSLQTSSVAPAYFHDNSIPVFRPTNAEFADFDAFVVSIDEWGQRFGIVKVIPPQEWIDSLPDIRARLAETRIAHPISQHFEGSGGVYRQMNMETRRIFGAQEFARVAMSQEHMPPYLTSASPSTGSRRKSRRRLDDQALTEATELALPISQQSGTAPVSDVTKPQRSFFATLNEPEANGDRKRRRKATDVDLDAVLQAGPFTDEFFSCKFPISYYHELEREYWRNLAYASPMYGADMLGTLFPHDQPSTWNMNKLDKLLSALPNSIPGVNQPYLYFGMWKATFAWHVEDVDLYSINYLHFGAPKQWYSIPPSQAAQFQQLCNDIYPEDLRKCSEFLRHKTFHFSPRTLAMQGITVNKLVQEKGEFVITFPKGYHAGYNLGFNCAESVNFATKRWIDIGKAAKSCRCVTDSVVLDAWMVERILRGEVVNFGLSEPDVPSVGRSMVSVIRHKSDSSTTAAKKTPKVQLPLAHYPCLLCIDDTDPNLLDVYDMGGQIHRSCAECIPECWIDAAPTDETTSEPVRKEVVFGFSWIPKDRFRVLCAKGKCTRSFHVSCARRNGVHFETRHVTTGTGHSVLVHDAYCSQHDPRKADLKKQEIEQQRTQLMSSLTVGKPVWVKRRQDGLWYQGTVEIIGHTGNHASKIKLTGEKPSTATSDIVSAYWFEISLEPPVVQESALPRDDDPYVYFKA